MAILIEGFSLVLAKDAANREDIDHVLAMLPQRFVCTDGQLARIAFMRYEDATRWQQKLQDEIQSDNLRSTIVSELLNPVCSANWLHCGILDRQHIVAWLPGEKPEHMAVPAGWDKNREVFKSSKDFPASQELTDIEKSGGVYRDPQTGIDYYAPKTNE